MATYDLHQHLWPEQFVEALTARGAPPRLEGNALVTCEGSFEVDLERHDAGARVRALDEDGIDVAVLSLQPSLGLRELPHEEREGLEEVWVESVRELSAAGEGRFRAFSPTRVREGFVGVSVGSSTFADFDRSAPILEAAARAETVVFVHPDAGRAHADDRPAWWEWVVGYPARMQEAYLAWLAFGRERWPTLRVLFAMLGGGGPFQLERLARRGVDVRSALDPNTFFEVSTHGRRAIELCVETFGVGQLAYGSDTPVVDSRQTLDAVRGFGDAVMHVLQSDTPERLLSERARYLAP
jgi:predicted TIM-barrel fold metal-dependent hydrolase